MKIGIKIVIIMAVLLLSCTTIGSVSATGTYGVPLKSTFHGGNSTDNMTNYGDKMAVANDGSVYIVGSTTSSNLPTTTKAYQTSISSPSSDVFVAKYSKDLSQLLACTYLGGSGIDYGNGIAISNSGDVYVTGHTNSQSRLVQPDGFPVGTGAYDTTKGGSYEAFVAKFDSSLSQLLACTFLGGGGDDYGYDITIDNNDNIYVTGSTRSTGFANVTEYGYQKNLNGTLDDAFLAKFDPSLSTLYACTYFGGSGADFGYDIAAAGDGNIYITGKTGSSGLATSGSYDTDRSSTDAFIARFNSSLNQLLACTYFGGTSTEEGQDITVGSDGNIYITGVTSSTNLPTTTGAYDTSSNGNQDAFLACFNNALSTLNYSTYYGGSGNDYGYALAFPDENAIIMGGVTASSDLPVNDTFIGNPVDGSFNGGIDLFMTLWFLNDEFEAPVAQFTADITHDVAPLTVHFSDTSSNFPTSWSWNFGDGSTSTQQNPSHIYNTSGTYTITLTVSNSEGSDTLTKTSYITVEAPETPNADFDATMTAAGISTTVTKYQAGNTVQFTDKSTNYPTSWEWDFNNDDDVDSTEQNPTWQYNTPGTYTVKLIVTNSAGTDTEIKNSYITIAQKLNNYSTALNNTNPGAPDPGIAGFVNGVVNPIFTEWASQVVNYTPANQTIQSQFADASKALGPVTGNNFDIVSLGDLSLSQLQDGQQPGSITLGFNTPIVNGDGADFAVFENGFISEGGAGVAGQIFAELGYVEVSSDGINFVRFPSISLTPDLVGGYGTIDPTNVYNLVGKHCNAYNESWGTPFDLENLINTPEVINELVDLNNINYVRIVDIPGCGLFRDSEGRPIYDAWITWGSGGLDLEAIGVINTAP